MKGQLKKLGLTDSQEGIVIQANRRGHLSLKCKVQEAKTSYCEGLMSEDDLLGDDSSDL